MQPHRMFIRDFMLTCSAIEADGGFKASVAIATTGWSRSRAQRFLDLPQTYETPEEAMHAAADAGRQWIADNAAPSPFAADNARLR